MSVTSVHLQTSCDEYLPPPEVPCAARVRVPCRRPSWHPAGSCSIKRYAGEGSATGIPTRTPRSRAAAVVLVERERVRTDGSAREPCSWARRSRWSWGRAAPPCSRTTTTRRGGMARECSADGGVLRDGLPAGLTASWMWQHRYFGQARRRHDVAPRSIRYIQVKRGDGGCGTGSGGLTTRRELVLRSPAAPNSWFFWLGVIRCHLVVAGHVGPSHAVVASSSS